MRLRPKLLVVFSVALLVMLGAALLGFPSLVDRVSETQLFSLAKTVASYLIHDLSELPFNGDAVAFEKEVDSRFEFVARLGTDTGNFSVNKILLIDEALRVEVGHPDTERGADYSSHVDIREAFTAPELRTVIERNLRDGGGVEIDADSVARIKLADGDNHVLEVKLDFTTTMELLASQYRRVQYIALGFVAASLVLLVLVLLLAVRRTILRPVLAVSSAMERVGEGDLDARAMVTTRDELGEMALHFEAMVNGLRERFELERYVSKSTVGVAKERASAGEKGRASAAKAGARAAVVRKRLVILFTDVRGFTAWSERTDPARVVAVLNVLLGLQEEIIDGCQGYVDKYVGDETMAIFERPVDAVAAAWAIREKVARIAGDLDGLVLGTGLHVGELVEGDIGSPRLMNHTVIGDTVNTAARLEAAAAPNEILVSSPIAADTAVTAHFNLDGPSSIIAKGKELPIEVWKVGARKKT
jgi:adenylate cyclase